MSRVGKQPIPLPKGTSTEIQGNVVSIKGPKGSLSQTVRPQFRVVLDEGELVVSRPSDEPEDKAFQGLYRALLNNMVHGVSQGFKKVLEIEGVGYSAKVQGTKLVMNIGFNAPVEMDPPAGVSVATPKNTVIEISGCDRQAVGQFAANVRAIRPPEPYKGKGIRYQGEIIRRKAGKAIGGKG